MANWIGVITNAGNSLLNEWVNEKALNFDSAAAGQGIVAEAAMLAQTTLVGQKQTASLLGGERVSAGIRLKLRITAPDTAYTLNQYGVWASVEGGTPAMIALFQHPQGVPIPSKAESPDFVYTFYGLIMCSNTGTWTVTVDTSAVVTAEDLEEAVAGKADQLALAAHEADGVKHVTAAERETLTQGFALLSDDVDTHIARTDNPHGVTAAQVGAVPTTRKVNGKALSADVTLAAADVGAAAASHSHGAGDIASGTLDAARIPDLVASKITSGTLPVARGGTGAASLTSGAALIGAGTGAVTTRAIKDNTSASAALTASSALVTMNTLRYALNRTTGPGAADTNYTTAMMRAIQASTTDLTAGSSSLTSGVIYLVYE